MSFRPILKRLRRLHPFTWCVALLASVAMTLITVAGQYVDLRWKAVLTPWEEQCKQLIATNSARYPTRDNNGTHQPWMIRVCQHGWPSPYLARVTVRNVLQPGSEPSKPKIEFASPFRAWGGSANFSVSWSNFDNWPLGADDWILRPGALVLDVVIATAILLSIATITEWWVTSRPGRFRFRLSELLAALTFGGLLLGWHQHHARIQRLEQREANSIIAPSFATHGGDMAFGNQYRGPDWLRRLTGSEYLLPFLHHVYYASVKPGDRWRDCIETLPHLPYLEEVQMRSPMPLEALSYLERCPKLERLSLDLPHSSRPLAGGLAAQPVFGVEDLAKLKSLRLTELKLSGDSILAEDLEQLPGLGSLRRLELFNASVTLAEIETIRSRHPRLQLTTYWYYNQFPYPTPPEDHDAAVAKARLSRQAFRCAQSEPSSR